MIWRWHIKKINLVGDYELVCGVLLQVGVARSDYWNKYWNVIWNMPKNSNVSFWNDHNTLALLTLVELYLSWQWSWTVNRTGVQHYLCKRWCLCSLYKRATHYIYIINTLRPSHVILFSGSLSKAWSIHVVIHGCIPWCCVNSYIPLNIISSLFKYHS